MPRRVGKEAAGNLLRQMGARLLAQDKPTPMGEPHRLRRTPVAGIFALMTSLTEEDANLMWNTLELAMWDEWDCDLPTGLGMFGTEELRVVTRTATIMAQYAEEHPEQ